jgi:hypothetical protein
MLSGRLVCVACGPISVGLKVSPAECWLTTVTVPDILLCRRRLHELECRDEALRLG